MVRQELKGVVLLVPVDEIKTLQCCLAGRHVKCGNVSIYKTLASTDLRLETIRGII